MDASPPLAFQPTSALPGERANTLARVAPHSLVPVPTATAMLLMGTHKYHAVCFFPLAEALTIGGSISLSLVLMAAVARAIVGWIFDEPYLTEGSRRLLRGLELLSWFLAFAQVSLFIVTSHREAFYSIRSRFPFQLLIIVVLTALLMVNIIGNDWSHSTNSTNSTNLGDDEKVETPPTNYCPFSMVVGTGLILIMTWFFVGIASAILIYLGFVGCRNAAQVKDSDSASFASAHSVWM